MGYQTDVAETNVDPGLLQLIRGLTPEQQRAAADIIGATMRATITLTSHDIEKVRTAI